MRSASSWSSAKPLALASAADRSMAAINCDHTSRLPTSTGRGNRLFPYSERASATGSTAPGLVEPNSFMASSSRNIGVAVQAGLSRGCADPSSPARPLSAVAAEPCGNGQQPLARTANHAVVFACSPAASTAGPEVALERYHPLPHAQPSADATRACVEGGSPGHPGCASSVAEPLGFSFSSSFSHGMSTSIRARNCSLIPTHRWVQWGAFSEMPQGLLMGKGGSREGNQARGGA